ncbi:MAG: hypothetical protein WBO29_18170 [Albidovulum sp.]
MTRRIVPTVALLLAFLSFTGTFSAPAIAGDKPINSRTEDNLILGLMLREFCVGTFPRFSKAESAIDSAPYFERRAGKKIWDHRTLAVAMSLSRIDGRPACVMTAISRNWKGAAWAAFAVPVFGATWDSDQTIVDKGPSHVGDNWRQHMSVRFPTLQQFTFDADRRSDGRWIYTIALIAAK